MFLRISIEIWFYDARGRGFYAYFAEFTTTEARNSYNRTYDGTHYPTQYNLPQQFILLNHTTFVHFFNSGKFSKKNISYILLFLYNYTVYLPS